MSSFYTQSLKLSSSLLGKRNTSQASFNLQEHLRNQFSRSHLSTAVHSDESRKTSYDHKEEEFLRERSNSSLPLSSSLHYRPSQISLNENSMNENRIKEGDFGRLSDSCENDPEGARAYAADLRFAPVGPRPPVPPLGGQISNNDAADTIKTNFRCL